MADQKTPSSALSAFSPFSLDFPSFILGALSFSLFSSLFSIASTAWRRRRTSPALFSPSSFLQFLLQAGKLKVEKRTGWVARNIQLPESIADHQYRMALMAALVGPPELRPRGVLMCLVHDMAEALTGDILPEQYSGISKHDKHQRERAAMCEIVSSLGPQSVDFLSLYQEYEEGKTETAKLVKQFDKAEMLVQALEYEENQHVELSEFFASTPASAFENPALKDLVEEIKKRRI